ncbi:MAG TPA: coproporphyrinogen III oxidase, partial [Fodinibius sp.]|nr:coproporphyrinogen III oxidase [Fodinibius sp.]
MEKKSIKDHFIEYIRNLQDGICSRLEDMDNGARFHFDDWEREGGGGGHSGIIEKGKIFEKGGVS